MKCRHCKFEVTAVLADLGFAPPSNSYIEDSNLKNPEVQFPLVVKICTNCWLAQTEDISDSTLFFNDNYAYFSSTSDSWVEHSKNYAYEIINRLNLNHESFVVEIASNDGYLLQNFVDKEIPCLGIEPTASTHAKAMSRGIPSVMEFFTKDFSQKLVSNHGQADLIIGNNVFAHVPDINDFTSGLKKLLKPEGSITLEFPHLLELITLRQFDTIYHEHFSYFSLKTVQRIFNKFGLRIWDVQKLATHGGSLRIFGCHIDDERIDESAVAELMELEDLNNLEALPTYEKFQSEIESIKNQLLLFLIGEKNQGKRTIAYGAAAKGNTLLNYAGVKKDLIPFVCDASPSKQGKYMPGSHIPIYSPEVLVDQVFDTLLILPWNIAPEIVLQHSYLRDRGIQFVTFASELKIL